MRIYLYSFRKVGVKYFWILESEIGIIKSSRSRMFFKIGALKNLTNFEGKRLRWILFLIKIQAFRPAAILKRDSNRLFPVKFAKFLRARFFIEHLWWLLHLESFWINQPAEVFCEKRVLKRNSKFHGKTPVLESLFKKVTGLKACNFIKKRR